MPPERDAVYFFSIHLCRQDRISAVLKHRLNKLFSFAELYITHKFTNLVGIAILKRFGIRENGMVVS